MLTYDKTTGWLDGVRHCRSPNFDDRPDNVEIELLVIHGISLPPGQYGTGYIDQLFTNTLDPEEHPYFARLDDLRVSSHLLILRTGEIIQYVPLTKRAWHAGASEFQGRSSCNDFSIGIELEGCDDEPYEDTQYISLLQLTELVMKYWSVITEENIVGHCDIAPGRKTDPGLAFDWHRYRDLIRGKSIER